MNLFDYQKTGRDFLADNAYAFLADDPGLGKTAQAINAACDTFTKMTSKKTRPTICVLCPRSAIKNWHREWKRWWPSFNGNLLVVNYDMVVSNIKAREDFLNEQWDLVICDEAHRLKSPGAKRSQTVYRGLKKHAGKVWLLSGTPARNHAGELWTHLVSLRPDLIADRSGRAMTQEQFEDRYCEVYNDKHGHRRIRGSKNLKELRGLLFKGGFLLRRRKKEVQPQLPALIFDEYPIILDDEGVARGLGPDFTALGIDENTPTDDVLRILRSRIVEFSTERRLLGLLKVPAVAGMVETELEAPGKIIVFFHHTDVGQHLKERFMDHCPVLVDGKTKDPQGEVDTFMTDPNCRVFLGQIQACGEALNITAANQVVFAEASWSPSDNYQAACRAHRFGLEGSLVVRFLSVAGTVDEIIQRTLARKSAELAELFD